MTTAAPRSLLYRVVLILALVGAACGPSAPATDPSVGEATASPTPIFALGEFPPFPDEPLPGSTAVALQAALDVTVEEGELNGVTAAIIVAGEGSWTGAAGSADGNALSPDSLSPTHSSGKTVVAAEVLRTGRRRSAGPRRPRR